MTKPTVPAVFIFGFNLDPEFHEDAAPAVPAHPLDKDHCTAYAFAGEIPAEMAPQLRADIDEFAEWYEDIHAENEGKFGVHDWLSGPDDRVICLGSFDSYEVEPAKVHELMTSWREALASSPRVGGTFGLVVPVPTSLFGGGDWAAYEAAVAAGSVIG